MTWTVGGGETHTRGVAGGRYEWIPADVKWVGSWGAGGGCVRVKSAFGVGGRGATNTPCAFRGESDPLGFTRQLWEGSGVIVWGRPNSQPTVWGGGAAAHCLRSQGPSSPALQASRGGRKGQERDTWKLFPGAAGRGGSGGKLCRLGVGKGGNNFILRTLLQYFIKVQNDGCCPLCIGRREVRVGGAWLKGAVVGLLKAGAHGSGGCPEWCHLSGLWDPPCSESRSMGGISPGGPLPTHPPMAISPFLTASHPPQPWAPGKCMPPKKELRP